MSAPSSAPPLGPACFDHVVLGVRDLAAATAALVGAGLHHAGGGEHTGRGTANSLFPLAEGYLELLTVTDPAQARGHSRNRAQVADALEDHDVIPLGYALQVADVARAATALERGGQPVTGPVDMSRRNPDGAVLTWRNLYVGASQWRTTLPFLISWDTPNTLSRDDGEPRLAGIELSGSPRRAAAAYELLGASSPGAPRTTLAGFEVSWTAEQTPDGHEGLQRILLTGAAPSASLPESIARHLVWA